MPELNKGFIPFSNEEKGYHDEVGNDYNPQGWNTASAMTYTSGSVTANGKTINVIKPTVDTTVNWEGFKNGVWNKIDTGEGGSGTVIPPIVKPITISTPDVIDKDNTTIKDFTVDVTVEEGSASLDNIKFEVIAGDTVIITQTVKNPEPGNLEFTIDDDTMKQIEESGVTDITLKITASDGKTSSETEKTVQFVHQTLFGISYEKNPALVPAIIEATTDKYKIQKRTIGYDETAMTLSPFYPTDEWAYMYIAVPKDWGEIKTITAGAIYEIGPNEWYPSTCKIKGIDYNLYVLQYNNEGTFEFLISVG